MAAFTEVFPKAERWNVAAGPRCRVGVGLPAWFAVRTSPRLVVVGDEGQALSERELGRGEVGPGVRSEEGGMSERSGGSLRRAKAPITPGGAPR